jgi:Family of unknown function (DUF6502)
MDPLIDLMLATGLTVHDLTAILRERAVRRAGARIVKESGREVKSRVAILTGLPRSEVGRILLAPQGAKIHHKGQHPARRVLAGWYDHPDFRAESGHPAVLPIFGGKRSFERLVARYSSGIPVRAMLDELIQLDAVEVMPSQHVKANSRVPSAWNFESSAIAAIGDRMRDLLDMLLSNLRAPIPLFARTVLVGDIREEALQTIRNEIAQQGESFMESANLLLNQTRRKHRQSKANATSVYRAGITAYYFQAREPDGLESAVRAPAAASRRKNLQRHLRTISGEKGRATASRGKRSM